MSANGKEYKLAIRIAGIVDKSYNVSLASANASLKGFKATMTNIDASFRELDKGFNKIMSVGKSCFHAITTAARVAAIAIGAVAAASIKIGSDFEAEMSIVQSISGATAAEMAQLSEKAREVAKNTVYSATEVGSAMEYMGMAGWKASQMIAGLDGVVALAAASGEDMAMVSDIVTDSLTAMGEAAEQSTHFANIMAQAAMNSNTNVELMGESFKYAAPVAGALKYSMEDLSIAVGLMSSSGIKGSLAGTALRNMLTRMAKPTKESKDAMEALGLSLMDDEGRMYSLLEIMQILRQNFAEGSGTEAMQVALKELAGLTDDQIEEIQSSLGELTAAEEAFYAAELGGQRGMSGLLAIANSTDEEFLKLTEAIYNAEGAAEKMASIRLDNLQGDVTILKDTVSDAGIELYYQFNEELRGLVQNATEFAGSISNKIPSAFRKISEAFPTIKRKFKRYAEPVFNTILTAGKWVVQHGRGIISIIAGIGAALAAYKIASTAVHLVNALMSLASLNPVTLAILGVVAAIGALTTAITAYKQYERGLIDESLSSHFGSIALSLEEIQKVAEYIVSSESLGGVKKALDAFEDLDSISSIMQDAVSEIDKLNWKISIGMELTEDENESYKQAIDAYIKAAQDYALQSQYAVSLNLQIAFSDDYLEGHNVVTKVNQFYQDKYDELSLLGTQLNDAITDAFNDGLLDIKETKVIADIQRQMAEIQEALATGEFDAQLAVLGMEYASGGSLTADSFQNLQDELANQVAEASAAYRESYVKNHAAIQAAYEAGNLNETEYQDALENLQATYLENVGAIQAKAINFQLETIMKQYAGELDPAIESYMQKTQEIMASYAENGEYDWLNRSGLLWVAMMDEFANSDLDKTTSKAIKQLLKAMQPSVEEMKAIKQQYEDMGKEVPESILNGISDFALLDMLSKAKLDYSSAGIVLGEQLVKSGYYDTFYKSVIEQLNELDHHVPAEVMEGISNATAEVIAESITASAETNVRPAVDGMYAWSQETIDEYYSQGFQATANVAITLNPIMRYRSTNLPAFPELTSLNGLNIDKNAEGGIIRNKELSWLAEEGPEAVVPLDGSRRAVSLWEKAGQLLGMDSILDRYDVSGGGQTVTIDYNPTLQFYGESPNKDDLTEALRLSQDEFDSMMERYLKTNGRVSFA